MSSPHDYPSHSSINDLIDKDACILTYVRIDDAIKAIQQHGKGALLCKMDIADAIKQLPSKSTQWPNCCIKWNQKYYVYVRLVFGFQSSPKIFDSLSQAISWIATHNYGIEIIFHLLDDFLTVDGPDLCKGSST